MSAISVRNIKPGNVVKAELLPSCGYARDSIQVLLDENSSIGLVVANDGDVTPYGTVEEKEATMDRVAVIIGTEVYDLRPAPGQAAVLATVPALVRGSIVGDANLDFGLASIAGKDSAISILKAQGVLVETQV